MSLFCCPICGGPLDRGPSAYSCPAGHSFDLAREGYVHLLPANRMHSKMPGDDKGMAAARAAFLSKDYYAPLRDALCSIALERTGPAPRVLDTGCGEGYYTSGVYRALARAGRPFFSAGGSCIIISYGLMGIVLSTYRYKNIYPRHPETGFMSINSKVKKVS